MNVIATDYWQPAATAVGIGVAYGVWHWTRRERRQRPEPGANAEPSLPAAYVVLVQITEDTAYAYLHGENQPTPAEVADEWPLYDSPAVRTAFVRAVQVIQRAVQGPLRADRRQSDTDTRQGEALQQEWEQLRPNATPRNFAALLTLLVEVERFRALAGQELKGIASGAFQLNPQAVAEQEALLKMLQKRTAQLEADREELAERAAIQARWYNGIVALEAVLLAVGTRATAGHALTPLEEGGALVGGLGGALWLAEMAKRGLVPLLEGLERPQPHGGAPISGGLPALASGTRSPARPAALGQWIALAAFVVSAPALAFTRGAVFGGDSAAANLMLGLAQTVMTMGAGLASASAARRQQTFLQQLSELDAELDATRKQTLVAEAAVTVDQNVEGIRSEARARSEQRSDEQKGRVDAAFDALEKDQALREEQERARVREARLQIEQDQIEINQYLKEREQRAVAEVVSRIQPILLALATELDRLQEAELNAGPAPGSTTSSAAPSGSTGATPGVATNGPPGRSLPALLPGGSGANSRNGHQGTAGGKGGQL